ncbi:erythromycin esterase family protein [Streptomyces sp. NPDC004610]|uniref:erythromycin esterase family protein n=1 Tax=unclassified Streptomyces TaxID=2593676 RepID=UPI0033A58A1D
MATDIKDTVHSVDAASVMALFPAPPRLLALGEPTHGEDTLLELRNDLFRQLVERHGYRTITIESDCLAGLLVDDHITSGSGTLDEVMERGFSHGLGASAANRDLVRWMRAFNEGRPDGDRLRFAGFDGPLEISAAASPRQVLTALHSRLSAWLAPRLLPCTADALDQLLGPDGPWTDEGVMWDPSWGIGRSPAARELRLVADDLAALLEERAPQILALTSPEELARARLFARTATGLLRYHSWMADSSPGRMTRLVGVRDQMMAENLLALAERGPTLVFAHNAHLQRYPSGMRMGEEELEWWSAGALASARLGPAYGVLAMALGTIRHQGVDTPSGDSVEGLLYGLPEERFLVDAPWLAATLVPTPAPRVSPWFGYAPLAPERLAEAEGIVYLRDVRRS